MPNSQPITIGHHQPVFFIAEAGVNHNGDVALAHQLVDVAAGAKADAIKFQTFRAATLVSPKARKAAYQEETTGGGGQFEMLRRLELPESAWEELAAHCAERGVLFLSSPFDEASVDLLVRTGVQAIKLGSGELTNRPLVEHVSLTGLPTIISTGMATRSEVVAAVAWFRMAFQRGAPSLPDSRIRFEDGGRLGLLHCVSNYPAADADLNLRAIATMREFARLPVGYSDHSLGLGALTLAVAAGACMLEKHFTLDRSLEGPDHRASLEPEELTQAIAEVRRVETILGHGRKVPSPAEADVREVARKSVVALENLTAGATLSRQNIGIRRPGTGLAPALFAALMGRTILRDVALGDVLTQDDLNLPSATTEIRE